MSATTLRNSPTWQRKQRRFWKPTSSRSSRTVATSTARRSSPATQAGITVTLPKPIDGRVRSRQGRFGKQDFVYLPEQDVYRCPAGERLKYYFTAVENGQQLRRYWTNACRTCAIKQQCTTGKERRITRWEHEHVVDRP